MTIDDFVAANPGVHWHTRRKIGGHNGVVGTQADGASVWVMVLREHHVSSTAPMTRDNVRAAVLNLEAVQPGKEFAQAWDDDLAKRFRAGGVRVYRTPDNHVTALKENGVPA